MQQSQGSTRSSNPRSKPPLEEKFVHLYKEIFSGCSLINSWKDSGIQGQAALTRFWDELLLLKVNKVFLIQSISNLTEVQLKKDLKLVLNELFGTCSLYLDDGNFIRVAHALETLMVLFQEIFKKRFSEQGLTVIGLIAGSMENADSYFAKLINRVSNLLQRDDVPIPVKSLSLRLFFTILTMTDNINTNVVASYFFQNNIMNAIVAALSVKLSDDRRCLELDATLLFILLLSWREGENVYIKSLAHPSSPLAPLLQTAQSLMAYAETPQDLSLSSTSQIWSLSNSIYNFMGSFLGGGSVSQEIDSIPPGSGLSSQEEFCLTTTAGVILAYSIIYHSSLMKLTQLWPSSNDLSFQSPGILTQSVASLWMQCIRSFLALCKMGNMQNADAPEVLKVKCGLNLLRCMVETKEALEFVAFCDSDNFKVTMPIHGISGLPLSVASNSILCFILRYVIDIINTATGGSLDPDLFHRASLLIPLIFNALRQRGWQLTSESIQWMHLWKGLAQICEWAGNTTNYQKSGVPELAELILGIIESCLGSIHDTCSAPEEIERLHAVMIAQTKTINLLVETISSVQSLVPNLVNFTSVKLHYEIQIGALGVRGCPTYEQALEGVQKRGILNLKLKPRHAGPTHTYSEGTSEQRLLINTTRALVAFRRKQTSIKSHRLEATILNS